MPVESICQTCGVTFYVKPYLVTKGKGKFCTRPCYLKAVQHNGFNRSGEDHWNYGGNMTEETKRKISDSISGENHPCYGKPLSKEARERLRKANTGRTGPLNGRWKGGITYEKDQIRTTWKYRQWKKRVLERDDGECVKCGDPSHLVHHILSLTDYPDEIFADDNGITVCFPCHMDLHGWNQRSLVLESGA